MKNLILTYDELIERINEFEHERVRDSAIKQATTRLFLEAKDNDQCRFFINNRRPHILICEPKEDLEEGMCEYKKSVYVGFYVSEFDSSIDAWEAFEPNEKSDRKEVYDGKAIGEFSEDISIEELISKCEESYEVCPICKKKVGHKLMKRYSFAGRCCPDCLPRMKEEHEYAGWYN